MTKKILWAVMACALVPACGGEAELGEECEAAGVTEGECVEGSICGQVSDTEAVFQCQKLCTDDAQCATTESCNGISGSNLKGCRPK